MFSPGPDGANVNRGPVVFSMDKETKKTAMFGLYGKPGFCPFLVFLAPFRPGSNITTANNWHVQIINLRLNLIPEA